MTDNQLFCKECGCGEDHHLVIQRLRELLKQNAEYGYLDIPVEAIEQALEGEQ